MDKRTFLDRRSGEDRREVYDLDYFAEGGTERRHRHNRRQSRFDRRAGWVRIEGWWASVYSGALKPDHLPGSAVPDLLISDRQNDL